MANITVRQLPTADSLSSADTLLISQIDGTTRKIPVTRLVSEGMLASDSAGSSAMVTRVKIWVGARSMTDIYGVNRVATDEWGDKAWQLVYPGRGNTQDDIHKTDFCHFVDVHQPVPCFVLNRPFINLHEALVWSKYNVPGGWELQIDICGSTNCFELGDKLGEFGPNTTQNLNLRSLSFIGKHRFVGYYNSDTETWSTGKGNPDKDHSNWTRWVPDASGQGGPHSFAMARGTYATSAYPDRRGYQKESAIALADIYVNFSGYSHIKMWFRDIPRVNICGITWADYSFGPRLGDQVFFRMSNGRIHFFGENLLNLEASSHIIANQRGNSFVTKHGSSTIVEAIEGGSAYFMCNLRHYSCGTTRSYYDRRQYYVQNGTLNAQYSPRDVGLSWDAFHAAPVQIVRIARVGSNSSGINGASTVIFDPLYHGWFRSLGNLAADRNNFTYHNGTTLASSGVKNKNSVPPTDAGFVNWASWQNYEWLTGGHENLHDTSWEYYDADGLNWYYLGVTPRGYKSESPYVDPGDSDPYIWDVSKASPGCAWQAWTNATVNSGGTYAETMPGIVKGPWVMNNGDSNNFLSTSQSGTHLVRNEVGDGGYGWYDGRGYRHFMRTMRSNGSVMSLDEYGSTSTNTGHFLQHYATGKNTRIVATINSPCSSAYYFGAPDAKIYLAKHYSTMNYLPDVNHTDLAIRPSGQNLPEMINDQYGGGMACFGWHAAQHNGNHISIIPGAAYPVPNTKSNPFGAFKYQENNCAVDHPLLAAENGGIPKNYPIIGGSEYVKFSDYPGSTKPYYTGPTGIGIGNLYIHQMPVIGVAENWSYQGTWNFAQYTFSHQNYRAGSEHKFLQPIPCFNNYWATGTANADVMKVWFDLESRPAIHALTGHINMNKEPYWWEESTRYVWNQMAGTPRAQGDSDVYGGNHPIVRLHGVIRNSSGNYEIYSEGENLDIGNTIGLQATDNSYQVYVDHDGDGYGDYKLSNWQTVNSSMSTVGAAGSFGNGNTLLYTMSGSTLHNTYKIGKNNPLMTDVDMKNYELPISFRVFDKQHGLLSRTITNGIQLHKVERIGEYFELTWEASMSWLTEGETIRVFAVHGDSNWVEVKAFIGDHRDRADEYYGSNTGVEYPKQVVKITTHEVNNIEIPNGASGVVFRIMNNAKTRSSFSLGSWYDVSMN
jgi:hypothetical protein